MSYISYLFINGFKRFTKIVLLSLIYSHLTMAKSTEQPVISAAHSNEQSLFFCKRFYLIQVFENGDVEYLGVNGVKVFGKHKTKISKEAIEKLLKELNDAGLTTEYKNKMEQLLRSGAIIRTQAIRIRQNGQEATFFNVDDKLMDKIAKVTKLEPKIGKPKECSNNANCGNILYKYDFNDFKRNK